LLVSSGLAVFTDTFERSKNEIEDVLMTNLGIPIFALNAFAKACVSREIKGSCVLVGSVFGTNVPRFSNYFHSSRRSSEVYGASKAGVEQLARYYASLLGKDGIRVNGVSPGGIYDPRTHSDDFVEAYSLDTALGRMTARQEVVDAIVFMLSEKSTGITGQTLNVDCGFRL